MADQPFDPAFAVAAPITTIGAPLNNVGTTLAQFRTRLVEDLGNRTDIAVARQTRWINESYLDLSTSLRLDELQGSLHLGLVLGEDKYMLPGIVSTIEHATVEDTNGLDYPLAKIDIASYRSLDDRNEQDGLPKNFIRYQQMLVLWPTPDSDDYDLTVDFRVRPLPLVLDTDSPILGLEWHEAIALGALVRGLRRLFEYDKAMVVENELVNFIRRRTDREAEEDRGRVVGSSAPRSIAELRQRRGHR